MDWWLAKHVHFDALDPFDGRSQAHTTTPVPKFRMKRARRILWECQQHPDWPQNRSMFFRHPSLRNVPSQVLKRLVQESEGRNA